MILEYVPGGELYSLIEKKGKLCEAECKRMFIQILAAVQYAHNLQVAHRDIKPENILLDCEKNIKLGDFGLSNVMKDGEFMNTSCGSANYAAPEVISGLKYCGTEADVWSLGVLLFALIAGTLPFDSQHMPTLVEKVKTASFTIPYHVPAQIADLLNKIIVADPLERLTISQILDHPWLSDSLPKSLAPSMKKAEVDEEVFESLLKNPQFSYLTKNKSVSELKESILSESCEDLFAVSYQILVHSKRKVKFVDLWKKHKVKKHKMIGSEWKGKVIRGLKADQVVRKVCSALVAMKGKWKFLTPYYLKTVIKEGSRKFYIKMSIRVYTVVEDYEYALDLKLDKGNYLRFLDLSCKLFSELDLVDKLT